MLYREIMAICSEIHTKHINTMCGLNVEFVGVGVKQRWKQKHCLSQMRLQPASHSASVPTAWEAAVNIHDVTLRNFHIMNVNNGFDWKLDSCSNH